MYRVGGAVADRYGFYFTMTAQCQDRQWCAKVNDDHLVESDPTGSTAVHDR